MILTAGDEKTCGVILFSFLVWRGLVRGFHYTIHTTVLRSAVQCSGAAAVDFFAGAEPIIGLEFVIMLATARELTQPRALRSHYLDHDGCSAVQCHALPPQW